MERSGIVGGADLGITSDACKAHLGTTTEMQVRQTRRGWCQELMGCEAKTEFKYLIGDTQIAQSLEDTDCCCRIFCSPIHPFKMRVQELQTEAELLTVDRPLKCAASGCKCCCYQEISVTSGGQLLGQVKEDCYYCVPSLTVTKADATGLYKVHPPTCCGGCCVNCCTEGNPCGKGCCKVPFRVYPAAQAETGGDAPFIGKILKKPKSLATEIFTDSNAFVITFPEQASVDEKAMLVGTSIFLNALFFEEDGN